MIDFTSKLPKSYSKERNLEIPLRQEKKRAKTHLNGQKWSVAEESLIVQDDEPIFNDHICQVKHCHCRRFSAAEIYDNKTKGLNPENLINFKVI